MSLSYATRTSTKWQWQLALIRAGGQDIATQLRERRIGCSSIIDWLTASSRFSEIVWQLMAFAPTNVSSYFWFSVWEFVGAWPLTVFPHMRSIHFFIFLGPALRYTYIFPFGQLPVKRKIKKKCCAGTSCWVDRRPTRKRTRYVIRSSVPTAASFSILLLILLFIRPAMILCVIRPNLKECKKNR